MGNFSRDPFQELQRSRAMGYLGLHVEQGVPVLDRDLNLLADLVAGSVREVLARHLGSGIAERSDAFAVEAIPAENDFCVFAPPEGGTCLVGGIQVSIDAPLRYGSQPGAPPLTTPADDDREDLVYLDVWVEEVDDTADAALDNADDVGMRTSVRLRPAWSVRVAEGARHLPAPRAGHAHCPLAMLERPRGEALVRRRMIVDLRQTGLNLGDLARRIQRIEDILFSPALDWMAGAPALRGAAAGDERDSWALRGDDAADRPELVTTPREHTT